MKEGSIIAIIFILLTILSGCMVPTGEINEKQINVSVVYFWDYPESSQYQPTTNWKEIIEADLNNITTVHQQCPSLSYEQNSISVRDFFSKELPYKVHYNCTFYGPIRINWSKLSIDTRDHRYQYSMQIWHRQDPVSAEKAYNNSNITIIIIDGIYHVSYLGLSDIRSGVIYLSMFLTDSLLYFPGTQVSSNPIIRLNQILLLSHEIAHLYRAPDHKTGSRRPDYNSSLANERFCIMGDFNNTWSWMNDTSILCDYCRKVILPYNNSFWHLQKYWPANEYWLEGSQYITEN